MLLSGSLLGLLFRHELARAWREPVLTAPVLILESDDWGYGPREQAARLAAIASILCRHRDMAGRPAVMTLGVILCGPDTMSMAAEGCTQYRRIGLSSPELEVVRMAMASGVRDGVFALQLHGMEHFWPEVLLGRAAHDSSVRAWLTGGPLPCTECLPAPLQSRWIDAAKLPSRPLQPDAIDRAAAEEVAAFRAMCGEEAEVAVPPTFVWTQTVEAAWARRGVRVIVTPGRRYGSRDAEGRPCATGITFHNGQRTAFGLTYLVRDDYFEPALGHTAANGLSALAAKTALGRPTLLEVHRANFLRERESAAQALGELETLLAKALAYWPKLRFMSSAELARHYRDRTWLIERHLLARLHVWVKRLARISRLYKLAWATGIAPAAALLWLVTRRGRKHSAGA